MTARNLEKLRIEIEKFYLIEGYDAATIAFLCEADIEFVHEVMDQIDQDEVDALHEFDDRMDGDFDSAMASAGMGTDEDYNHYDYQEDY